MITTAATPGSARRLAGVAVAALLGALLPACGINNIPTYEERARAAWSEVLGQYQRRAELIPGLVETVGDFAGQERAALDEVAGARDRAARAAPPAEALSDPEAFRRFQEAQNRLSEALGRLLVAVERHPELKESEAFLALQSRLEDAENRIAIARRDYIQAARDYNTELRTIPGRWWRALLYPEAEAMETFTAGEDETEPPRVKF